MEDLREFENRLMSALPYAFRFTAEEALRSYQESRVMLHLYCNALRASKLPLLNGKEPMVVAFGSFGRLDGSVLLSDYDVVFLYSGPPASDYVNEVQAYIRRLVSANEAFPFDHRPQIVDGSFDFSRSPAYPILSTVELLAEPKSIRSLQVLTEGRCLTDESQLRTLRENILNDLGFSQDSLTLDLTSLRDGLAALKSAFLGSFKIRLATEPSELRNRKILKLMALREFFYLVTLLSIAEVALVVAVGACSVAKAATLLSAPMFLKLLSLSDPQEAFARVLRQIPSNLSTGLYERIEKQVENAGDIANLMVDGQESELPRVLVGVRTITLGALIPYDKLLQKLHSPGFLDQLDKMSSDVTTWLGNRTYMEILSLREEMLMCTKALARAVLGIVDVVQRSKSSVTCQGAQDALEEIISYSFETA